MYINSTNGAEVSVEEMQQYATEAEMSIEEYAAAAGFSLKSDEVKTKEAEKVDFPTSAVADADAVQQPMTASQAGYVEPEDTELAPVDTSLDSQPDDPFVINGKAVTEQEFEDYKKESITKKMAENMSFTDKLMVDLMKGSGTLGEMLASIPETIYDIGAIPQNIIAEVFDIKGLKASSKKTKEALDIKNPILEYYEKETDKLEKVQNIYNDKNYDYQGISKNFQEGNYSDGFKQLASGITESAPVSISMMIGGAAATTKQLMAGSTVAFAGPEIKDQLSKEGQSELTSVIKGLGLAGAESVFSSIGSGTMGKVYKDIILKEGKEKGVKIFRNGLVEMYSNAIKKFGAPASMVGEGIEEVATTITQNLINDIDPFSNVTDSFIQGVGGGALYGAPVNAAKITEAVKSGIANVNVNKNLKKSSFKNISEVFLDTNANETQLNILKNKGSLQAIDSRVDKDILGGRLTKADGDKIKTTARDTQGILNRIETLKLNEKTQVKVVDLIKEKSKLNAEIKRVNDKALTNSQIERVNSIDKELQTNVAKDLTLSNIKTVESLVKDVKGLTIESLDNAEAIDNFIKENNLDIDSKKASNQQGFIYQNPETGDQTIIINKEVSTKEQAVNVAAHEFLHGLIFQTVKNSPETQLALGKSLNEYINKIDATQIKDSNFAKRLESYKDMDEATQSEEVLTLFSDAIATGDIQFNESVFTKIGDVIRRTLQNLGVKVKFNNGKDVYNFVKDYNKSIEKGVLTKAQKTVAKTGATGTLISEQVQESKPEIKESKQLTPEQDTQLRSDVAEIKKEASEGEALAKKFNKDFVKGAKQTRLENKVLQEIKPIVDRVVTNRTKALYDPIAEDAKKNVSRQMFQESMRSDIESMVFDEFTGKQDLEKFIVNRAFLRANNLAERLGIKGVEEGITKGLEAAEKVAVEETAAPKADKPKYRNILKSNTLPTETVNTIKDKVLKTVRTLKSKLDAKVSKNKTVTPLIAEIKKDMGKQADIDFKKAMGGKKDGQIRRFLIKNKKTVLENMTTTWLMGAMPGAVQKQVNGSFTSDWQGKKIDREKTSTQQAGRTSGAEIVRRLPNAFKNLDDKTYLSYIIDESGAPIRGRKESLAKAMAEELSFDIFTAELQNENSDIRKAFEGNQEALGVTLADNYIQEVTRDIERGTVKFAKSVFIKNQDFVKVNTEFAAENRQWKAIVKTFGLEPLNLKTEADRILYRGWIVGELSKYLPKSFFENNGTFTGTTKSLRDEQNNVIGRDYAGNYAFLKNEDLQETLNKINNFSKDSKAIAAAVKKQSYNNIAEKLNDKKFNEFQDLKIDGLKDIFLALEQMIKDNPANIPFIAAMLSSTSSYQGHFIRVAAPIRFYTIGIEGSVVEEHTLPASLTAKYLFKLAVEGNVSENFNNIKRNYFQGSLARNYDDMLKGTTPDGKPFSYKETPPEGWMLDDDIWARYFNKNVATNNGGIPAYNIILANGISVMKKFDINSSGYKIPKAISNINYSELKTVETEQKAIDNGRSNKSSKSTKKIRVFDFDDTLARTKSNVLYTMPGAPSKVTEKEFNNLFKQKTVYYHGTSAVVDQKFVNKEIVKDFPEGASSFSVEMQGLGKHYTKSLDNAKSFIDHRNRKDNTGTVAAVSISANNPKQFKTYQGLLNDIKSTVKNKDVSISERNKEYLSILKSEGFDSITYKEGPSYNPNKKSLMAEAVIPFDSAKKLIGSADYKQRNEGIVKGSAVVVKQNKLNAGEFAAQSETLLDQGAEFDFSEFSKVMNGQEGPLLKVAKIIAEKRGTDNLFVLTARPQDAAGPIQEFLAGLGLDIPLKNITGLADGNPKAKANWMVEKVADGYNDFYFADDHLGNVKAVKDVFNTFDVKGKVQQAKVKFSKGLDKSFNDMIERQTGTESFKEFSKGVAQRRGKKVGKFKIFVSPSAEDFRGLTQYKFAGKGKQGEADQKFFEEALMDPYFKGVAAVESSREVIKNDTKALFKMFKPVKKKLNKLVPGIDFTYDGAVRVYLWNKAGIEIPGLTKRDNKKLNDAIANDPELSAFADALLLVSKQDTWPAPTEYWEAKTTLSDLNTLTEKTNRKEYLTEFIENVDIIFSEKNLNKVEALYGKTSRVAIENTIYAMKTGSNSPNQSGDGITNRWLQWVNNSIGTIMFFNRRSALLQLTSATNFLNWSDNNPAKAALAFANQPQYWKDWAMIFNSDKLKQRRSGLKSDVQESEIANAAKNTEDKIGSIIAYLLKIGFSPTQIADSIAISSGGATFYRNRVNSLKKQGLSVNEAEAKAFEDFSKLSDEAQQSGDPALVSQQQRSVAGRLILSFQNTTMQYTRLMKKSGQDLINGRGDAKTHISKILYYGALQNFIFNALSQTAFALIPGFDDDEDEDKVKRDEKLEEKASRVLNGMTDSIIRGTGIYGAVVTTLKNTYNTWEREADKGFKGDQAKTILEAANISPAIGSKLRKIYSAIQAYQFDKAVMEKHPWSVTIDGKFNPSATYSVIGNLASAALNLPLDRALAEARGVAEMFDNRNSEMQRIALALGWRTWNVGADNEEFDLIKMEAKQQKKEDKKAVKADFDVYRRKVFKVLTRSENSSYSQKKGALAKKEYILKLGKQKGIK